MEGLGAALELLSRTVTRRRRLVLAAAAITLVVSPAWIVGLRVHADSAALVPAGDPAAGAYRRFTELFGEPHELVVRIPTEGLEPGVLDGWTERLAETIAAWPDVSDVRFKIVPHDPSAAAWWLRAGALNDGEEGRGALLSTIDPDAMRRAALRVRRRVLTVGDPALRRAVSADPLGLVGIAARWSARAQAPMDLSSADGFLDSAAGGARLLIVHPRGSAEDGAYCRDLLRRIDAAAARLAAGATLPPVALQFAGVHALTAGTMDVVVRDLGTITVVAGAALLVLLWACFGSGYWIVLIFTPLLVGQAVFLAAVRYAFGPINYLSIGFAAVVLGLGLDFGLHLATRLDLCRRGVEPEEEIAEAMREVGPPIVVAALTTSAAFACLALSSSPFLVQFGLLTATGLLITLLVTLLVFPALAAALPVKDAKLSLRRLLGGGGRVAAAALARRSRTFATVGTGLVLASLAGAVGFRFEMDLMRLFPDDLPAQRSEALLRDEFGMAAGTPLLLTLRADDLATALTAQVGLEERLAAAREGGTVAGFSSPLEWLVAPDADLDGATWENLARGAPAGVARLRDAFDELGLVWGAESQRYGELVVAAVTLPPPYTEAGLAQAPAPVHRLVAVDDGVVALASRVVVRNREDRLVDAEAVRRLAGSLQSFEPDAGARLEVTAITEVYGRLNESIRAEFFRLSAGALAVVLLLALAFLRAPWLAVVCLVPLLAAIPATLALTHLTGIRLTPATVGFAAVVIGIGIDDAIHLVVRRARHPQQPVAAILQEVLPVITLTTASTALAFAALTLSAIELTRSIGLVTAAGVILAWLFSWLLLPSMLARPRPPAAAP